MSLTPRQAAGLLLAAALGAVVVLAALLDRAALALAGLGAASTLLFLAVLQIRRRIADLRRESTALARELRATTAQLASLREELAAAARERDRAALTRHGEMRATVVAEHRRAATEVRRLASTLSRRQREQTREVEALLQLFRKVEPAAPMPSSGMWALNPTELLELWSVIERTRPRLVLELGSGTSSVWIGYALRRCQGRLVSLEHQPEYGARTRAQLARHSLTDIAEVRDAPLRPVEVEGEAYSWYDLEAVTDLDRIDLLVVDGPPGATGPLARYPAVPLLANRLADPATVILDDVDREDEQEILRRWTGARSRLSQEVATIGHLGVLTYTSGAVTTRRSGGTAAPSR